MRFVSVRILFGLFIVVAGLLALYLGNENVTMFCLGAAASYITPNRGVKNEIPAPPGSPVVVDSE